MQESDEKKHGSCEYFGSYRNCIFSIATPSVLLNDVLVIIVLFEFAFLLITSWNCLI